jgi:hypothetical protein
MHEHCQGRHRLISLALSQTRPLLDLRHVGPIAGRDGSAVPSLNLSQNQRLILRRPGRDMRRWISSMAVWSSLAGGAPPRRARCRSALHQSLEYRAVLRDQGTQMRISRILARCEHVLRGVILQGMEVRLDHRPVDHRVNPLNMIERPLLIGEMRQILPLAEKVPEQPVNPRGYAVSFLSHGTS